MKIGIDIDDTITNTYDVLVGYIAAHYNLKKSSIIDGGYSYDYMFTHELEFPGYTEFSNSILRDVAPKATIKKNVKTIIKKLHDAGHTIEIVSARHDKEYRNPYEVTEKLLKNNNIYYDKINVNVKNKGKFCKDNHFDLLIDDNVRHLQSALDRGIDAIIIDNTFNRKTNRFKRAYDWNDVLKLVDEMSVN